MVHGHLVTAKKLSLTSVVDGTGTSLQMIEDHYGSVNVLAEELDDMIAEAQTRNLVGTLANEAPGSSNTDDGEAERFQRVATRAGDRGRTGDVQLGKLKTAGNKRPRRS